MIIKTLSLITLLSASVTLSSCVTSPAVTGDSSIVGTWKWTSANHHAIGYPFYIRYGTDAKMMTWPAPEGWSDSKGISHGTYSVANGTLTLYGDRSKEAVATSKIRVRQDQLIMTTEDGNQLVYQRVLAPVQPGKLEDGSPAGFSKHPR